MPCWTYSLCMNSSMDKPLHVCVCICVKTHYTTVCFLFGCRKKALQGNTAPVKNTPVTITEPKKKMKEWLSCLTKIDMMETVITLFVGAGKKKGPLDWEQYVHVLHLLPGRISLYPTSLFTQSLRKMMSTSTLGTGADRPNDQSGVHLLKVHLSGKRGKNNSKERALWSEKDDKQESFLQLQHYSNCPFFFLFFLKSSPVQTVQGYKRWRLQWVRFPGQGDSAKGKQS